MAISHITTLRKEVKTLTKVFNRSSEDLMSLPTKFLLNLLAKQAPIIMAMILSPPDKIQGRILF